MTMRPASERELYEIAVVVIWVLSGIALAATVGLFFVVGMVTR